MRLGPHASEDQESAERESVTGGDERQLGFFKSHLFTNRGQAECDQRDGCDQTGVDERQGAKGHMLASCRRSLLKGHGVHSLYCGLIGL